MERVRRPGKTESGHEAPIESVVKSAGCAIDACVGDSSGREVDVGLLVVDFGVGLIVLPAQTHVDRHVWCQFVIILNEKGIAILTLSPATGQSALCFGGDIVAQEV